MTESTIKQHSSDIVNGFQEMIDKIKLISYLQSQRNQSIGYVDPDLESFRYRISQRA